MAVFTSESTGAGGVIFQSRVLQWCFCIIWKNDVSFS